MNMTYNGTVMGHEGNVDPLKVTIPVNDTHILEQMSDDEHKELLNYLVSRLQQGQIGRDRKLYRYAKIDRLISTWQKLNKSDSARERAEEISGRQQALPMNLPLLATHLDDTAAFFAEVFAPISGAFFVSSPEDNKKELAKKMNRDAKARDYYSQVCLTFRSLIKYNIGGFHVDWEKKNQQGSSIEGAGNRWMALNVYNTLWDPTILDVSKLSTEGEWAAFVERKNRIWLARRGLAGELARVDKVMEKDEFDRATHAQQNQNQPWAKRVRFYRPPPASAGLPTDALDERTSENEDGQTINWASFGAAIGDESQVEIHGFEVVTMYCWVTPCNFGLLTDEEEDALEQMGVSGDSFVELWKFKIVDGEHVVFAEPVNDRNEALRNPASAVGKDGAIGGSTIPMHLAFMNQDQMEQAQRSTMELLRGFQRFVSYLANVYIAGLRKNVWGVTAVDKSMFDTSRLREGDVAGIVESKIAGRDVRTGMHQLNNTAGVDTAMSSMDAVFNLVQRLFPSQGLPNQVAGIDRAVKGQVAAVMQGATRRLHMLARLADSSLFGPARLTSYENLSRYDSEGISDMEDEDVMEVLGSGIESLEAERVADFLQEIMVTAMQNQESSQQFDLPGLLNAISKTRNLGVSLGDFAKQQAPAPAAPGAPGAPGLPSPAGPGDVAGGPGIPSPEDLASLMGQ